MEGEELTERLRLQHSRVAIRHLANTEWTHRADGLRRFSQGDAWLWSEAEKSSLEHRRIIAWMKSPKPEEVIRYYRLWGINDIFSSITRKSNTRRRFFLKLTELVEKRNNIAHGDFGTEATANEVREYRAIMSMFCDRVDRRLARMINSSLGINCEWY